MCVSIHVHVCVQLYSTILYCNVTLTVLINITFVDFFMSMIVCIVMQGHDHTDSTVLVLKIRQSGFFQVNFWRRILEVNSARWTVNNYFQLNWRVEQSILHRWKVLLSDAALCCSGHYGWFRNSWYIAERSTSRCYLFLVTKSTFFTWSNWFDALYMVTSNNIIIDNTKTHFLTWPFTVHSF